ncbi:hypothetical protein G7N98_003793 [Salmonella enterica]|nr:hypothetical protein [Salmonella enterica]
MMRLAREFRRPDWRRMLAADAGGNECDRAG